MLPAVLRRAVPDRLRDDVRLRAVGVASGLIPPRALHGDGEIALLRELAGAARRVVEIGVYEGGSAVELCDAMHPGSELHLIDPFGRQPGALPAGWGATEWATRRLVARAARRGGGGPAVHWHVELSADTARTWTGGPVDLVFVDGDHLEPGVLADWEGWHPHVVAGGHVVFHDARDGRPDGLGLPGPTAVVDRLVRGPSPVAGWELVAEVDRSVCVRRVAADA
jgi:hypothetical protein